MCRPPDRASMHVTVASGSQAWTLPACRMSAIFHGASNGGENGLVLCLLDVLHAVSAAASCTVVLCCRFLADQPGRCGKGGQAPLVCRSGLLVSHGKCQLRHTGEQAGLNLLLDIDMKCIPTGHCPHNGRHALGFNSLISVPLLSSSSSLSCRNIGIMAHIDAGKVRAGSCPLFYG